MSFILDALKKSQIDRQRRNEPENAFIPSRPAKPASSRWLAFLGVLLLINVVVVSVVFLKNDQNNVVAVATTGPGSQEAVEAAPFEDIVAAAKRTQPKPATTPVIQRAAPVADIATTASHKVELAPPGLEETGTNNLPHKTFNDVVLEGSVQLSELHLDIHVYSEVPGDRFVFINMSKYKEGSALSEGPSVTKIVPEGVVLEYGGTRFLLPRE